MSTGHSLTTDQRNILLETLQARFEKNKHRHPEATWRQVLEKLEAKPDKLWSLHKMEKSGGEPDVIECNRPSLEYVFYDCSSESPVGRRNLCYDHKALESRKEHKPSNSALDMATAMGIELLTEGQYRKLQEVGEFDKKTASWILTPVDIRKQGGALFCDRRYDHVFVYHNGAESYYSARGFRGYLVV